MWFFCSKAASPSLGCIVTRCNNNFLWLLYWSDLKLSTIWLALEHEHVYMVSFGVCVYVYIRVHTKSLFVNITMHTKSELGPLWAQGNTSTQERGLDDHFQGFALSLSPQAICARAAAESVWAGARHVAISQFLSGKLGAHYQWPL